MSLHRFPRIPCSQEGLSDLDLASLEAARHASPSDFRDMCITLSLPRYMHYLRIALVAGITLFIPLAIGFRNLSFAIVAIVVFVVLFFPALTGLLAAVLVHALSDLNRLGRIACLRIHRPRRHYRRQV